MSKPVETLFKALRLQWLCKKIGFERLSLKNGKLRCYFPGDPQSSYYTTAHFKKIMAFVEQKGRIMGISLKQTNRELIFIMEEIKGLKATKAALEQVVAVVRG